MRYLKTEVYKIPRIVSINPTKFIIFASLSLLLSASLIFPYEVKEIKENTDSKTALDADNHYQKGLSFYKEKKYDQAIAELKKSIGIDNYLSKAYKKIFDAYKESKKIDLGLVYFTKLESKNPKNAYPCYILGKFCEEKKIYDDAIQIFEKAINLFPRFAEIFSSLIDSYNKIKRLDEGIQKINAMVTSNNENPYAFYGLAYAYWIRGNQEEALNTLEKAIVLDPDLIEAYNLRINIFIQIGKFEEALAEGFSALELAKRKNIEKFEELLLGNIGTVYFNAGNYDEALKYWKDAIKFARQIGEREDEAKWLNNVGSLYRIMGNQDQAISFLSNALEINKTIGSRAGEGIVFGNIGDVYTVLADYDKALSYYEKALKMSKEVGDKKNEAINLGTISAVYSYQANYPRALEYGEKAVKIDKEIGYKPGESADLGNIGCIYFEMDHYAKALEYFREAFDISLEIGDKYKQEIWLNGIANVYYRLGNQPKALEYFKEALRIAEDIGDKIGEGAYLTNIGIIHFDSSNNEKAKEYFDLALRIFKETGDRRSEGVIYGNLAILYDSLSDYPKAIEFANASIDIQNDIGNQFGEAESYKALGSLLLKQKKYKDSVKSINKALEIAKSINAPRIVWEAEAVLANTYETDGKNDEALQHYKSAITTVEAVREQIPLEEQKSSFLENKIDIYKDLINLLYKLHQKDPGKKYDQEAYHYAERAKARALLDILQESKLEILKNINPIYHKKQNEIFRNISSIRTELRNKDITKEEKNRLLNELKLEEENLEELKLELRRKNPVYANLIYPIPLNVPHIQKEILQHKGILIEYSLGKEDSYAWIIHKNEISMHRLPTQIDIEELVEKYLALITHPPVPSISHRELGKKLFDVLLKPLKRFLNDDLNLIIVPDGVLHYLPFETLIIERNNNDLYLTESAEIGYSPSASVLAFILENSKRDFSKEKMELLAFADPVFGKEDKKIRANEQLKKDDLKKFESIERGLYEDQGFNFQRLPYTALEIKSISSFFPENKKSIYVGSNAIEEKVKKEPLNKYRNIHFATHGMLDEKIPGRSCIVLTLDEDPIEDGFLQMNEIFNLKLDASLVVLSACQTGKGKLMQGEGLIGLTRAFFYAGTESLLVSLWSVNDRSTAELMGKFYEYWNGGKSKSESLRKAKLDLIRGQNMPLRHPYYWAPFIIIGNKH